MGSEVRNAPVEVVEKAEEVEAELDEGLFLVVWEGAEYLCGIVHVVSAAYPEREASVSGGVRGEKMVTGGDGDGTGTHLFIL